MSHFLPLNYRFGGSSMLRFTEMYGCPKLGVEKAALNVALWVDPAYLPRPALTAAPLQYLKRTVRCQNVRPRGPRRVALSRPAATE